MVDVESGKMKLLKFGDAEHIFNNSEYLGNYWKYSIDGIGVFLTTNLIYILKIYFKNT